MAYQETEHWVPCSFRKGDAKPNLRFLGSVWPEPIPFTRWGLDYEFGGRISGAARPPMEFDHTLYQTYTPAEIREHVSDIMRNDLWSHADKHEALHDRHSDQWSDDLILLGKEGIYQWISDKFCEGVIVRWQINESIGNARNGGLLNRIIAGADWLAGEAGRNAITSAQTLLRGSEAEVRQRLRNRIVMSDSPVPVDAPIDAWPPLLGITTQTRDEYYESRFAFEEDKEPATSVYVNRNVRDESSLEVYLNSAVADPRGGFWLAAGQTATLLAVDAAGNARKATLTNDAGTIAENLQTGTREEFSADIPSGSISQG